MNVIVYVFFSYLSSFISFNSISKKFVTFSYCFFSLVFSMLIGFRSVDVPDTEAYSLFFSSTNPASISDVNDSSFEIGFQFLTKILKLLFGSDVSIYFCIVSCLNCFLIYKVLYNFSNGNTSRILFGLNLYLAYYGLFYNAIVMRQGIALSLFLLAMSLLYKSYVSYSKVKTIKVVALLILSCLFHLSALLGVLIFLIFKYSKVRSISFFVNMLMISIVAYFTKIGILLLDYILAIFSLFIKIFEGTQLVKFAFYQDLLGQIEYNISFKIIFLYITVIIILLGSFYRLNKIDIRIFQIYMYGVFLISLFGFIDQISRVLDYFLIFSFILLYKTILNTIQGSSRFLLVLFILGVQMFFVFRIINLNEL